MPTISRRELILGGASAANLPSPFQVSPPRRETITVETFRALSARLTGASLTDLNPSAAGKLLDGFLSMARGADLASLAADFGANAGSLAADIVAAWYSGNYHTAAGLASIGLPDALCGTRSIHQAVRLLRRPDRLLGRRASDLNASMADIEADVIIVGSGISGALLAAKLSASGVKVAILEAGARVNRTEARQRFWDAPIRVPECPYPPTPQAEHPVSNDPDYWYRQAGPNKFKSTYLKVVGGTTWHWLGTCLRFMPNDFRLRTAHGRGLDWPIGYDDLEPFYSKAEHEDWRRRQFQRDPRFAPLCRLTRCRPSRRHFSTRPMRGRLTARSSSFAPRLRPATL